MFTKQNGYQLKVSHILIIFSATGWRGDYMVQCAHRSCRGSDFGSQLPHLVLTATYNSSPRDPMPILGLLGYICTHEHSPYTDTSRGYMFKYLHLIYSSAFLCPLFYMSILKHGLSEAGLVWFGLFS